MDDDWIFSVLTEIEEYAVEHGFVVSRPRLIETYAQARRGRSCAVSTMSPVISSSPVRTAFASLPIEACKILPFVARTKLQGHKRHPF